MVRFTKIFVLILISAVIWTRSFGDPNQMDYAQTLFETSDGGFISAGSTFLTSGTTEIFLIKMDSNAGVSL